MATIVSLEEGIAELVGDGDVVAPEGFTHLIPHAAGLELLRQGRRELTVIRMTPDLLVDRLIGAGAVGALVFSWGGNPGVGSLHRFRDAVENGWPHPLHLVEHTHASMAAAWEAGAAKLPFGTFRGAAGTHLPALSPAFSTVRCPFTGETLTAVAAHRPDVALLHAQRADRAGNVQLWGILGVQEEVALASRRVLVTVEEVVDRLDPVPGAVVLPASVVTRVAVVPGGAHPSYTHGYSRRDNAYYRGWDAVSRDRDRFLEWLDRQVGAPAGSGVERVVAVPEERDAPPGGLLAAGNNAATSPAPEAESSPLVPAAPGMESSPPAPATPDEVMTIVAARSLRDGESCFVGIGLPSAAANLARRLHAPGLVLIYESGTLGAKPDVLPLSIGDGELAETADSVISLPHVFSRWLQGGRVDVGFLGGAQVDRFGNLNSTVIGPYRTPAVRLPGAGGAPEIAAHAREVFIVMRQTPRTFVERLDFLTSPGFLHGGRAREEACLTGGGPTRVITDLGVLEPDPMTRELILTAIHPGVEPHQVRAATGWELKVHPHLTRTPEVSVEERSILRELQARTRRAHA